MLLGANATLLKPDHLDTLSRLRTDAPVQHVLSARQVARMLAAHGTSFARYFSYPKRVRAEMALLDDMSTYIDELPRFMTSSKETLDETLRVFRSAYTHFRGSAPPDDQLMVASYLRHKFPATPGPEALERLAKAIVDIPNPAALRRIAHLSHLSTRLSSKRYSLAQLLQMSFGDAYEMAWTELGVTDHGGSAAIETFKDWFTRISPNAVPPHSTGRLVLDLDEAAKERARKFAKRNLGKSLPDLTEASEQEWGRAARDSVTAFYDARIDDVLDGIVSAASQLVRSQDEAVWYIEFDVINLGGLNKHFKDDQPQANVHVRRVCSILLDVLSPHAKEIVPFRIAGDEFGLTVTGLSEERLRELLSEVRRAITDYTESVQLTATLRLSDIETPKKAGQSGFGLHVGYKRVGPTSHVNEVRAGAAQMIDLSKKGELHW
ncbi:hypothetical protein LJR230_002155 [Trinickia sp. LjRoot230]|uniref:hypothetical protein n=1 Tax=Trinickia sp. LjRoot230 TaxID=3342288 RepID=UPI003ECF0CC9